LPTINMVVSTTKLIVMIFEYFILKKESIKRNANSGIKVKMAGYIKKASSKLPCNKKERER